MNHELEDFHTKPVLNDSSSGVALNQFMKNTLLLLRNCIRSHLLELFLLLNCTRKLKKTSEVFTSDTTAFQTIITTCWCLSSYPLVNVRGKPDIRFGLQRRFQQVGRNDNDFLSGKKRCIQVPEHVEKQNIVNRSEISCCLRYKLFKQTCLSNCS